VSGYYLAIDGGGTKTDAVLFTSDGVICNRVIGEGTNPNGMDFKNVEGHFRTLFSKLMSASSPGKINGCFAGLSGSDHPALVRKLSDCIRAACPVTIDVLQVGNDAMNALWSGTDGKSGLVVIAGTGSIAFGILPDGKSFRVGGWGYLFGDEGSGYDIGRETIRRVLMAYDQREQETLLTSALTTCFHVRKIIDIIPVVYQSPKSAIAGLVPVVAEMAKKEDALAISILDEASDRLISLIQSGLLRFAQKPAVVLAGGVWKCERIRHTVVRKTGLPFIFPEYPPVYGAIAKCVSEWENGDRQLLNQLRQQLI
jgi:Predicted N-acetylglucosamine kinase